MQLVALFSHPVRAGTEAMEKNDVTNTATFAKTYLKTCAKRFHALCFSIKSFLVRISATQDFRTLALMGYGVTSANGCSRTPWFSA